MATPIYEILALRYATIQQRTQGECLLFLLLVP